MYLCVILSKHGSIFNLKTKKLFIRFQIMHIINLMNVSVLNYFFTNDLTHRCNKKFTFK